MLKVSRLSIALWLLAFFGAAASAAAQDAPMDRTVLPIQEPKAPLYTGLDARDAKPPPRFQVKAPDGAPNVMIVLLDDMGFSQASAFGGPIHMPTLDSLASGGLRFNQFHTTALCSPTRTALLSGRNHHMNNMGAITELATAFPGNTGQIPNDVAPVAEMLRLNGYSTAMFGKNHNTAAWEVSVSGPTDRWPTRQGFDKFYGFMGGETNQWAPLIYDGTSQVETPRTPNYNFMTDMTDQAINWVRAQKSLTPDRPFFIYFAPGATHAPHHAPKEWIDKYRGKFDQGWDKMREETLARQIALGVVPPGTPLAPKPQAIKDWDKLSPDEKRLFSREMEVFAGFGEYADTEIGRLVDAVRDLGQLDNTLVFYIVGDNGASAEGGMNGVFNEYTYFNGVEEPFQDTLKHIDELGGPLTYSHYAAGWAVAGDTPFTWTKQVASSYGGTRNPLVMYWPKRIKGHGEVLSQWHHVVDVAPTILEAARLPEPTIVNGTPQTPIQGVSMLYAVDDHAAADRHLTQYFEIAGNRALYDHGWLAGTVHKAPWEAQPRKTLQTDVWELYDTRNDFSLVNDLASKQPDKLKAMQDLFMHVASINHVLPIDDRTIERFNPAIAGRPDLMAGRNSLTVYPGVPEMAENAFINIKNRSHTITADIVVPKQGAEGVILAQGGRFGGWSLYVKDGKPVYTYNWLGLKRFDVTSGKKLEPGNAVVAFKFAYDGGGPARGGLGALFVNGEKVAEARIEQTQCCAFAADEGADVGRDDGTPVSEDYQVPFAFNGVINKVTIDLGGLSDAERAATDQVEDENRVKKAIAD
jgi:arylsulfatase A-like enzyme